jgi:hypothetical protein
VAVGSNPTSGLERPAGNGGFLASERLARHAACSSLETVLETAAFCFRCGQCILPGEPFDLGHDGVDRSRYTGPEHRRVQPQHGTTAETFKELVAGKV